MSVCVCVCVRVRACAVRARTAMLRLGSRSGVKQPSGPTDLLVYTAGTAQCHHRATVQDSVQPARGEHWYTFYKRPGRKGSKVGWGVTREREARGCSGQLA